MQDKPLDADKSVSLLEDARSQDIYKAAAESYSNWYPLRSAMQLIPCIGGAIDAFIGGLGAKYQQERIAHVLKYLDERLTNLEKQIDVKYLEPSEPLFDLLMETFRQAIRTRSEAKREYLANIVVNKIARSGDWTDAEFATHLMGNLSELHIQFLLTASNIEVSYPEHRGVFYISKDGYREGKHICELLPEIEENHIRVICSDLLSKGLLYDEGLGRAGIGSMVILKITELGKWFIDWVKESPTRST